MSRLRPCVLLDRDGTINVDAGYVSRPEQVRLIPGSAGAIRRLNETGVAAVVVTNQSGLARGYFGEDDLAAVNGALVRLLTERGARLDAIYCSPYHPRGVVPRYSREHPTRKPGTGMIDRAVRELGLDRSRACVVGDKGSDLELARNAGMPGVLVRTGYGEETLAKLGENVADAGANDGRPNGPDESGAPCWFVAADLAEAVDRILRDPAFGDLPVSRVWFGPLPARPREDGPKEGDAPPSSDAASSDAASNGPSSEEAPHSETEPPLATATDDSPLGLARRMREQGGRVALVVGDFREANAALVRELDRLRQRYDLLLAAVADLPPSEDARADREPGLPALSERAAILSAIASLERVFALAPDDVADVLASIRPDAAWFETERARVAFGRRRDERILLAPTA